jgi:hypothetical protein
MHVKIEWSGSNVHMMMIMTMTATVMITVLSDGLMAGCACQDRMVW